MLWDGFVVAERESESVVISARAASSISISKAYHQSWRLQQFGRSTMSDPRDGGWAVMKRTPPPPPRRTPDDIGGGWLAPRDGERSAFLARGSQPGQDDEDKDNEG
ncbi:hypothetical protein L249_7538 [Ophiocordyceps polyrhachis-furcata BCC 54312]|uniref:Uncharacterized protein n=1 Tax=Ophiocordyceps polyrhachis-furcata BCC 54312 TaxID=1330021 RepID=A0A367L9H4_9HYPO|nr:hypothetical protein L249_7538 [Ophiocordyceps polyrhachis-furcata BCC 54312]